RPVVRLQPPRRLPAVHDREGEVHQDDVGLRVDRPLQRLHAVRRLDDLETTVVQVLGIHLARVRIIIDDENPRLFVFVRHLILHLRCRLGRMTVNVDPFPGSLSTVIRPPSIWESRRQIDSPSPVPLYARVGELSSCRKSSKIFSWSAGAIPIPVSLTAMETARSCGSRRTLMVILP